MVRESRSPSLASSRRRAARWLAAGTLGLTLCGWTGPGRAEVLRPVLPSPTQAPQPVREDARLGLPLTDFVSEHFVGSWRCAACHTLLEDQQGRSMSIADHWRSTMMANAAKDPFWQAKVQSEAARHPALREVIEGKCATCHMPMAWRENAMSGTEPSDPAGKTGLVTRFLRPDDPLHQAALDGVSCSLCHQIQDQGLGTPETFSGQFVLKPGEKPERPIFGPYPDPVTWTMRTSVGFTPELGPHTNDSALCGSCHTLYTPYVDELGEVAGKLPEQTIYLEWLHSGYREEPGRRHPIGQPEPGVRTCQECHMPHSEAGPVMIARHAPPEAAPKDHFSRHHFVGGNALMMNLFLDHAAPLELSASTAHLAATRQRTLEQLQERTARLSLVEARREKGELLLTLAVESLAGHKFPSGFPSRRAWLHLIVLDAAGEVVFESGGWRPDGSIIGDAGDAGRGFEPHYQRITAPEQVQIYESVMEDTAGQVTFTLLRGSRYAKDNRLLPQGFDKRSASPDIAVHGKAETDKDFTGGGDRVTYRVATSAAGPFTVQAELLYTPLSFGFAADLRQDDRLPLVRRFFRFFDQADKSPVVVAAVREILP